MRLKKRNAMADMQAPLAAAGEWATTGVREEAATRTEAFVAAEEHINDSLDSSGSAGGGEKWLHLDYILDIELIGLTSRLDMGMKKMELLKQ